MQHDLFHIYTVDAHTLNLIKHLRKLQYTQVSEKFPLASKLMGKLPKPELIYLAGLYHDIGKGRHGDHSEIGAVDAEAFCQRHQLPCVGQPPDRLAGAEPSGDVDHRPAQGFVRPAGDPRFRAVRRR
jgi:hypothetical protein